MSAPLSPPIFPPARAAHALFANKAVRSVPLEVLVDPFVDKVCTGALEFTSWRDIRQALTVQRPEQSAVVLPWLIAHLAARTKSLPDQDAAEWSELWSALIPSLHPWLSRHPEAVAVVHTFAAAALKYDRPIVLDSIYHNNPVARAAEILSLCLVPSERGPETLPPELIPEVRARLIASLRTVSPLSDAAWSRMLVGFPGGSPSAAPQPSPDALAWALDIATAATMSKMAGVGMFQIRTAIQAERLAARLHCWPEGGPALARIRASWAGFEGILPGFTPRMLPNNRDELGYACCSARGMTGILEDHQIIPRPGLVSWLSRSFETDVVGAHDGVVRGLLSSLDHGLSLPRLVTALAKVLGSGEFPPGSGSTLAHLAMEVAPSPSTLAALLDVLGPSVIDAPDKMGQTPYAVALISLTAHPNDYDADELKELRAGLDRVVLQHTTAAHESAGSEGVSVARASRRL